MKLKSRNKISAKFEMSSMTDLVFLLLIFFMLITTLIVPNVNTLKLTLPSATGSPSPPPKISVAINQNLQYFINGKLISPELLEQNLQAMTTGAGDAAVILHTDNTVPIENVVKVMDIANRLKVKMVLATYPEK